MNPRRGAAGTNRKPIGQQASISPESTKGFTQKASALQGQEIEASRSVPRSESNDPLKLPVKSEDSGTNSSLNYENRNRPQRDSRSASKQSVINVSSTQSKFGSISKQPEARNQPIQSEVRGESKQPETKSTYTRPESEKASLYHETSYSSTSALASLDEVLRRFLELDFLDYDECAEFCWNNSQVYNSNYPQLRNLARAFLQENKVSDAKRVVRYYVMLGKCNLCPDAKSRYKLIESLVNHQEQFLENCRETFQKWSAQSEYGEREPGLASEVPETVPTTTIPSSRGPRYSMEGGSMSLSPPEQPPHISQPGLSFEYGPLTNFSDLDTFVSEFGEKDDPRRQQPTLVPGPDQLITSKFTRHDQEVLDANFKLHYGWQQTYEVFRAGSVIAIFMHQNYGLRLPSKLSRLSRQQDQNISDLKPGETQKLPGGGHLSCGPMGEYIFSNVRRFVVVLKRKPFSIAIPITTYTKQGLTKKNVANMEQDAHAIVYSCTCPPKLRRFPGERGLRNVIKCHCNPQRIKGEPLFSKDAIGVWLVDKNEKLSNASRLCYAKPHTIEWNTKVKHIGYVLEEHLDKRLLPVFLNEMALENKEDQPITEQPHET